MWRQLIDVVPGVTGVILGLVVGYRIGRQRSNGRHVDRSRRR